MLTLGTQVLGKYAQDPEERAALFELADNRELYVASVEKSQKNLREILSAFPSVEVSSGYSQTTSESMALNQRNRCLFPLSSESSSPASPSVTTPFHPPPKKTLTK